MRKRQAKRPIRREPGCVAFLSEFDAGSQPELPAAVSLFVIARALIAGKSGRFPERDSLHNRARVHFRDIGVTSHIDAMEPD